MKRKLTGFLLVMMAMIFLAGIETGWAEDIKNYNPNLRIKQKLEKIVVKAGENRTLTLTLENNSSKTLAKNIVIEPLFDDINQFPFELTTMNLKKIISVIWSYGSSSIDYNFDIPLNIKPGTYPIKFKISYENTAGTSYENIETLYVKVENGYRPPLLGVVDVDFEGEKLIAGKPAAVTLKVKNSGSLKAKDIYCTLEGFKGEELSLYKSENTKIISKIESNKTGEVTFDILPYEDMASGKYELLLKTTFIDDYGKEYKAENTIFLPVDGKDQNDGRVKIIVDNYDFGGDYVKAGQPFNLSMSFLNTSTSEKVDNIKITLTSEGVFSPVGSSNSFYIQRIGAQEKIAKNIVLKPKFDAEHKNYDLNVDIEYGENSEGDPYVAKETISIQVIQDNRLEFSEVEMDPEAFIGQPLGVSLEFYNRGRSTLNNMMVKMEGDFNIEDANYFVGNFEAGSNDYYEATIYPDKEGEQTGKIIFEFEDAVGNTQEVVKELSFTAAPAPEIEDMDSEMAMGNNSDMEMEKKGINKYIGLGGILILLMITVMVIRKKRKKKQEGIEFDE